MCEEWTSRVDVTVYIPMHAERFLINKLSKAQFHSEFKVKYVVQEGYIVMTGFQARVNAARQMLDPFVADLRSLPVDIKPGQDVHIRRVLKKQVEKDGYVCIHVDTEKVYVVGVAGYVEHALNTLLHLLDERVVSVQLPCVEHNKVVSWAFVKPTLTDIKERPELGEVVQPSSGPGRVDLRGLDSVVGKAEELLAARLRCFIGQAVEIDQEKKAVVIGTAGANIKRWETLGVFVVVGDDRAGDNYAYVGGMAEEVDGVAKEIVRLAAPCRMEHAQGSVKRNDKKGGIGGKSGGKTNGDSGGKGGKTLCRFFLEGRCDFGERCTYLHDVDATPPSQPPPRRLPLCRFYKAGASGSCRNGKGCQFSHDDPGISREQDK